MSELISQPTELPTLVTDQAALDAQIALGASEIYFTLGTPKLRGAQHFTPEDLPQVVKAAHERHVRVFLAVTHDIAQRELGQAVRLLKLAADAGIDAVLVHDPALIQVRPFFPSLDFHFSIRRSLANSEDARAAGELGMSRVLLTPPLLVIEPGQHLEATSRPADKPAQGAEPSGALYDLTIDVTDKAIACTCRVGGRDFQWTLPKTVVHRKRKAVSIRQAFDWLKLMPVREHLLGEAKTNSREYLMVPRAANSLPDQISDAIRHLTKPQDETLRLELPDDLRTALAKPQKHAANRLALGDAPDRVRIEARHVAEFVRRIRAAGRPEVIPSALIVEHASHDQVERLQLAAQGIALIMALPPVFVEGDISNIRQLIAHARANAMPVEVNSWGGWKLARETGAQFESGPAMGIINTLAAAMLASNGFLSVAVTPELERKQFEDLTAHCPAPCSITVFGRPALLITKDKVEAEQFQMDPASLHRKTELRTRLEHGLWTLRPLLPFDLRGVRNKNVSAAHLVVDLVASFSPADEWLQQPAPSERP